MYRLQCLVLIGLSSCHLLLPYERPRADQRGDTLRLDRGLDAPRVDRSLDAPRPDRSLDAPLDRQGGDTPTQRDGRPIGDGLFAPEAQKADAGASVVCPVGSQLVACYTFDGPSLCLDSSPNHLDLTVCTGIASVPGKQGHAIQHSASSMVEQDKDPLGLLNPLGEFSVDLWFQATTLPADGFTASLLHKQEAYTLHLSQQGSVTNFICQLSLRDYNTRLQASLSNALGTWHHVACTMQHSTFDYDVALYLDGIPATSGSGQPSPASPYPLGVGASISLPPVNTEYAPFDGLLDTGRIWSRVLTPQEITCIATEQPGCFGPP